MSERITVHVTSKDRSSELALMLHSLLYQTYKEFDIMILDDAWGTPIMGNFKFLHDVINRLKIRGHGIGLLRNDVSYGVCKARQRLVDEDIFKDNPYMLRLDDDQVLEPDYMERLVKAMKQFPNAGIVSGVTPLLSGPDFKRSSMHFSFNRGIVNRMEVNDMGDVVSYADDCGMLYDDGGVLPAHNFRSSALMKREMFDKGLCYEKGLSMTGFREECFLSLRALLMGYKCYVDLQAIAWHAPALSGGCRASDYVQRVQLDDRNMREWVRENKDRLKEAGL